MLTTHSKFHEQDMIMHYSGNSVSSWVLHAIATISEEILKVNKKNYVCKVEVM